MVPRLQAEPATAVNLDRLPVSTSGQYTNFRSVLSVSTSGHCMYFRSELPVSTRTSGQYFWSVFPVFTLVCAVISFWDRGRLLPSDSPRTLPVVGGFPRGIPNVTPWGTPR